MERQCSFNAAQIFRVLVAPLPYIWGMKTKWIWAVAAAAMLGGTPGAWSAADAKKAAKPTPYPLKTCVVSDEKLGEMGDPYVFTYQGREVKLCCKSCRKDFDKEPAKFVKKMDAAGKKKN